ncbi:MAG: hypothetical protein ACR2J3_07175 [Aridibacter sp.]
MKKIIIFAIILFTFNSVFAQTAKPLTQAEYVKMLYASERDAGKKDELIEAIRRRGIDFELTGGLRSLTATKGRNDAELKRTVEEANRRRENPNVGQLPKAEEVAKLINETRQNTLAAVDEMPDFVVKQRIKRSAAYAGTNNFKSLDNLIVAVSYRANGQEEYKLLSKNGVLESNPESKQSYSEVGGTSSTGEFVTILATIFKRESDTKFEVVDTDTISGRPSVVFDFSIERDKAQQKITSLGYIADSTIAGMKGRIWIDREKFRVLKIESTATEIPSDFPVRTANRTISYDWVKINDEMYLLPSLSDVRLTFKQGRDVFESRNLIQFKDYQKFGSEVIILDDDNDEIIDDGTVKNLTENPTEEDNLK